MSSRQHGHDLVDLGALVFLECCHSRFHRILQSVFGGVTRGGPSASARTRADSWYVSPQHGLFGQLPSGETVRR
jgi:hypothetical protein